MHAGRLFAVVAVICLSGTIAAQEFLPGTGPAALRLISRAEPSIARVYSPPPPEGAWTGTRSLLFFVSEPLTLELEMWNQAGVHAVLVADDPARGVTVRVRRQEGAYPFGGSIVDVPVRYHDRPSRVYQGVAQPQGLDRRMPLAPDEAIRWSADVDLSAIEPGLYVFHLTPAVTEESGIHVAATVSVLAFEVRARTPDAAREIMLRAGWRAILRDDHPEAERLFQEMRAAFPDSAAATRSLALVYELQNRPRDAREMLQRTRDILAAGADVALTAYREEYRGESLVRQLRALDEQIERLPR